MKIKIPSEIWSPLEKKIFKKKSYPSESVNSSSIKGISEIPGIKTSVTTSVFDCSTGIESNCKKKEFSLNKED